MKKLLLSSLMAVAGLFAMNAAETTIVFSDIYGEATISGIDAKGPIVQDGITITFAKGNSSNAPAYNKAKEIRLYGGQSDPSSLDGNTMTVAIGGGSITKIDLAVGNVDKWGVISSNVGNVTEDADHNASWTGNAGEIVFTVSRDAANPSVATQNRYRSITITFDEGEVTKCSNPKFGLNEGTYYTAQNVELTCNTDGATIVYQINDGAETEYTAPIVLSEVGSYTISAYAKKDGIDNSDKVSATYEIAAPAEVSSLAEFQAEGEANGGKIVYKFTFPVTVTYQNASNLYVKDAEGGAMLIYGNQVPKYEVGDVIPAGIMGEYTNFSGLPEMQYPVAESFADATQNVPTYPIAMKAGEITLSDLNKVVVVTGNVDETGKVVTDATGSLALYYQKAWNVETPAAGEYDVVCAVAVYKTDLQAYPISFNEPGSGVDDAVAAATTVVATANGIVINAAEACTVVVYNAAGQAVETVNVAAGESTVNVPAGFYIVKAANTVCKVLVK